LHLQFQQIEIKLCGYTQSATIRKQMRLLSWKRARNKASQCKTASQGHHK